MSFISHRDLAAFYELFVNALSFTVAINAVDSATDVTDLLLLAGTALVALIFGFIVQTLLNPFIVYVFELQNDDNLASFVLGPLRALKFLIEKFIRVVTHFLSTTLGRWLFVTLGDEDLSRIDIVLITIVTLTLAWLISVSAGFVEPLVQTAPPSNYELERRLMGVEACLDKEIITQMRELRLKLRELDRLNKSNDRKNQSDQWGMNDMMISTISFGKTSRNRRKM